MALTTANQPLLTTFQKHIEDMRNQVLCKICIKPLYEPYVLSCGHTYCYSCLTSWFTRGGNRRGKLNCPDCRARVVMRPVQNYVLRDLVHMFISRAELLPEDETTEEHAVAKEEESDLIAADRAGGGLFRGSFKDGIDQPNLAGVMRLTGAALRDVHDNVDRCPNCHWELEHGECGQCGWYDSDEDDEDSNSSDDNASHVTIDSELDEVDPIDQDFDGEPVNDFNAPWGTDESINGDGVGSDADMNAEVAHRRRQGPGSDPPTDYDDAEDTDMDGFIDNGEGDRDDAASIGSFHRDAISTAIDDFTETEASEDDSSVVEITTTHQARISFVSDDDDDDDDNNSDDDSDNTEEPPRPQAGRRRAARVVDEDSQDGQDSSAPEEDEHDSDNTEDSDDTATVVQPPARHRGRQISRRALPVPEPQQAMPHRRRGANQNTRPAPYPRRRQSAQRQQARQRNSPEARQQTYPRQTARRNRPFRQNIVA